MCVQTAATSAYPPWCMNPVIGLNGNELTFNSGSNTISMEKITWVCCRPSLPGIKVLFRLINGRFLSAPEPFI